MYLSTGTFHLSTATAPVELPVACLFWMGLSVDRGLHGCRQMIRPIKRLLSQIKNNQSIQNQMSD
ncbi:hypothetical protein Taro_038453 [Colocasia esculenta]|uniref:Uncharacterized protein n=1 Tax=Colocasia esculenta TaxID=4460 RepID=A0A843WCV6_COLES|nr:hypothetical protein [Colocasia esculenta]